MSVSVCEKHGVLGCGDCELEALREVIARREAVIRILEDDVLKEKRRADEAEAKLVRIAEYVNHCNRCPEVYPNWENWCAACQVKSIIEEDEEEEGEEDVRP